MDAPSRAALDALARLGPGASDNAPDPVWLADFRCGAALLRAFSGDPEPVASVSHIVLPGPAGDVPVRLYRPRPGRLPLLVHLHGGGGIAGSVDGHDPALRALANRTGWLVAAPLYRLAPEHPFPAPHEDAFAALAGLVQRAEALGADPDTVVVCGDSLGGTFATVLAALARDRGGPRLAGQILLYPNTDLRAGADYPSRRSEDGHVISAASLERQIRLYVATPADRFDPSASPILRVDLTGLPPALVVTCGADPLRDEGEAYADRLAWAGIAVTRRRLAGTIHAVLQMAGRLDATSVLLVAVADWLAALRPARP